MQEAGGGDTALAQQSASHQARSRDERLFRDLQDRFAVLAETCSRFSKSVYGQIGDPPEANLDVAIRRNLAIARRVFAEGLLEILAVVYLRKSVGFEDLRGPLGGLPPDALKEKLGALEDAGLVQRESKMDRPEIARYSLTHKGIIIARLGEPIFQYLRIAEGWSRPE